MAVGLLTVVKIEPAVRYWPKADIPTETASPTSAHRASPRGAALAYAALTQ
jgi:hypothetical protein